jgi:CBS domain-containing protein
MQGRERSIMVTARDIMTREVETVSPDDDVSEVLTRLAQADFNGFPVTEDGIVVGIVTQGDLVDLFQPSDRTLWIPIGFPPFLESLTYAIDLSWDELDVGLDMAKNAGRSISEVMTDEVVTVGPKTDIDEILALIADPERDINRLPVVDEAGALMGIIARQDVLRTLKEERDASKPTDV